jgi:hypothetical protein
MKLIAILALTFIILGLALATPSQAEENYIYKNAAGQLVISNKPPPAGSEILKKLDLTDGKQPGEDHDTQPSERTETAPKPSKSQ